MLAALLLVFREVLEAALVITIVMAATRGVQGRMRYILSGVGMGVLGALALAGFTDTLSRQFDGAGLEIFNALVLFSAVALLTWHVVWMSSHGRELAAEMKSVGRAVSDGTRPLSALAIVIAAAVLREGAEIVLFMQGLWVGATNTTPLLLGSFGGLCAGMIFGALLYFGMLRIPLKHLFSTSNYLLIAIAAGMAAKAANYLVAANVLPQLSPRVWDSSAILADDSWVGQTLSAFIGYTATPSGIQLLFFGTTIVLMLVLSRHVTAAHASLRKAV